MSDLLALADEVEPDEPALAALLRERAADPASKWAPHLDAIRRPAWDRGYSDSDFEARNMGTWGRTDNPYGDQRTQDWEREDATEDPEGT